MVGTGVGPAKSRVQRMTKVFGGEIKISNVHLPAAECRKCCAVTSAKHGKVQGRSQEFPEGGAG